MLKLDDFIKMGRHQRNHPEKHFWTNDIPTLILPFERKKKDEIFKFFEFKFYEILKFSGEISQNF